MAARGAHAAASDAGNRSSDWSVAQHGGGSSRGISPRSERSRLCRGAECCDRVPFCRRSKRSLPALAADLVNRGIAVLFAGANAAALAAKAASTTIPVVFAIGADPVQLGLVTSLNRPGGNVTGITFFANQLEAKRLGLLHELVAKATTIGVLIDANNPAGETQLRDVQEAAPRLGVQLVVLRTSVQSDFAFRPGL